MAKQEARHGTLYRQYRPQKWEEVKGQEHVTETLKAEVKNKKIAHAYLFAGSRGTGKTTVARILAQSLGTSEKDLYEMDAASNRGIDDIRMLREGVYATPFESAYKVYIIDEAHMLTRDAWNAFLKTLEEPPKHAIFVLATTERDKVPDTIQSRCEIHAFRQPPREVLVHTITDVAKKEGFTMEKAAAELIALLAEGSFRDALSILQKILSASVDKKVSIAEVEMVSGAPRGEIIRQILGSLVHKDASAALAALQGAITQNLDARTLTKLLIHRLRVVLLMRFAPELAEKLSHDMTDDDRTFAEGLATLPTVNSELLRTVLEAQARMAYAALPHLPLELAIIDICGAPEKVRSN